MENLSVINILNKPRETWSVEEKLFIIEKDLDELIGRYLRNDAETQSFAMQISKIEKDLSVIKPQLVHIMDFIQKYNESLKTNSI